MEADWQGLRELSAGVFGNRYRAELLAALAQAGPGGVSLGDLAAQRGVRANVYHAPTRVLIALGLVEMVPQEPGERRRFYRATGPMEWWRLAGEMAALLNAAVSPDRVQQSGSYSGYGRR